MEIIDLRKLRPGADMPANRRAPLLPLLTLLSWIYDGGVRAWRAFPVKPFEVGVPIISIGSIAAGGTGKTPLTMAVAEWLRDRGLKVTVVSRGWRRKSRGEVVIVCDGGDIVSSIEEAGDEPYLIARRVPGIGVVVARERYLAIRRAIDLSKPDVFLFDDGFQYRRVRKTLEVVCLDRRSIPPLARLLPLGLLREPFSVLKPEHIVVMMRDSTSSDFLIDRLRKILPCRLVCATSKVSTLTDSKLMPVARPEVSDRRLLAVSGIANPGAFEASCVEFGLSPVASLRYDDHKWYDEHDEAMIARLMEAKQCNAIITTEKDILKLPESLRSRAFALRKQISIEDEGFWESIERLVD